MTRIFYVFLILCIAGVAGACSSSKPPEQPADAAVAPRPFAGTWTSEWMRVAMMDSTGKQTGTMQLTDSLWLAQYPILPIYTAYHADSSYGYHVLNNAGDTIEQRTGVWYRANDSLYITEYVKGDSVDFSYAMMYDTTQRYLLTGVEDFNEDGTKDTVRMYIRPVTAADSTARKARIQEVRAAQRNGDKAP